MLSIELFHILSLVQTSCKKKINQDLSELVGCFVMLAN